MRKREESAKLFADGQDGVSILVKRKISDIEASSTHLQHRKKVLDETSTQVCGSSKPQDVGNHVFSKYCLLLRSNWQN